MILCRQDCRRGACDDTYDEDQRQDSRPLTPGRGPSSTWAIEGWARRSVGPGLTVSPAAYRPHSTIPVSLVVRIPSRDHASQFRRCPPEMPEAFRRPWAQPLSPCSFHYSLTGRSPPVVERSRSKKLKTAMPAVRRSANQFNGRCWVRHDKFDRGRRVMRGCGESSTNRLRPCVRREAGRPLVAGR